MTAFTTPAASNGAPFPLGHRSEVHLPTALLASANPAIHAPAVLCVAATLGLVNAERIDSAPQRAVFKTIAAFSFTNETEEAQRRARSEADPLQIGPSFRRLPGKVSKAGEKWETTFEYPDNDGTRVHVCEYELKEFALRQQRRCARIPWIERIYLRQPRAPFPGKAIGGGAGEFWIDIDHHVLVFHSQESAYETGTVLKTPKRGEPDKMLEMETFFTNVLKIEMRLSRITQK